MRSTRPDHSAPVEADYNVAPTTEVLTVVERHDREDPDSDPTKRIRRMRWGLVPSWTKELGKRSRSCSTPRADSLAEKPAFRTAFKFKRCLVPMDGVVRVADRGHRREKGSEDSLLHATVTTDHGCSWRACGLPGGTRGSRTRGPVLSCSIVTVDSLGHLEQVHDRMPLALPRDPLGGVARSRQHRRFGSARTGTGPLRADRRRSRSGRWSTVSRTTGTS